MPNERPTQDIRALANRFRGMLNERETQALSAVRASEVKEVGAPAATPGVKQTPGDVADRYRHVNEKTAESRSQLGELRPTPTPQVPKQRREGLSR